MDWTRQIDAYCERTDFSYWSEPINAVTNAAFLLAALIMWRRGAGLIGARLLAGLLFAIGIGSFLFHTHATAWAALSDIVPILLFILVYLFLVHRTLAGWPIWAAALATAAFLPVSAGLGYLLSFVPFLSISGVYWTVPVLLVIYAGIFRSRFPATTTGFLIGAALLSLSITLRSLDGMLCEVWPLGTHPAWHLLNALMLGWMIEVYRRHVLEGGAAGR